MSGVQTALCFYIVNIDVFLTRHVNQTSATFIVPSRKLIDAYIRSDFCCKLPVLHFFMFNCLLSMLFTQEFINSNINLPLFSFVTY